MSSSSSSSTSLTFSTAYSFSSLVTAAKEGNLFPIEDYIGRGGWVDMPDPEGKSLLYHAAENGKIEVINYLLLQGAHIYPTDKGETLIERASEAVKSISKLQKFYKKSHKLDYLIKEKRATFESAKEIIPFLKSIPLIKYRSQGLRDYAMHTAFYSIDDAQLLVDSLNGRSKIKIIKCVVTALLGCGDIEAARQFSTQIPATDPSKRLIELYIIHFADAFQKIEKKFSQHTSDTSFKNTLEASIDWFIALQKFPEEEIEDLIDKMSTEKFFTAALNYANTIKNNKLRGFIRYSLAHKLGLNSLFYKAKEKAEKQYKKELENLQHA